jgi:hypothetical protein
MTTTLLEPTTTGTLRIEAWTDAIADGVGHDPRSRYVEIYWLPVLGPSTTLLLRRLAGGLDAHPEGFEMDLDETARALGLGTGERKGRHAPFMRTLGRCVDFEMAQLREPATFAVRRRLPSLERRHVLRLPARLREDHDRYLRTGHDEALEQLRSQCRLLAASLAELGEDRAATELQLMRWSFHPAMARQCAAWAHDELSTGTGRHLQAVAASPQGSAPPAAEVSK